MMAAFYICANASYVSHLTAAPMLIGQNDGKAARATGIFVPGTMTVE